MKRIKTYSSIIGGLFLLLITTVAESQVIRCATMEQDSISRQRFPQRGDLNDFEYQIQQKIKEISLRNRSGRTQATTLTIPIVVHVVHNGEAIGTGANLSQEQIKAQIEVLNEDFRKKAGTPGFNTNPVGADIEIEFCLSPVNASGAVLSEPGIDRIQGAQQTWSRAQIDGTLKPSTIWNPNLFFNVWTLKFGGEDSNLLGYAQFPDQSGLSGLNTVGGPATTDGVVIQYTSFGSADKGNFPIMQAPYNKGRTLTHETGHFFGLRHIWGDGSCGNDFVDDTPTQQNESRGCPTNKLSCDGNTPAMVQNYMDYSDDACMNIFTNGQKARILAVLELSPRRKTLGQDSFCGGLADSKPVARFTIENQKCILLGSEIAFTDLSANFPTSWSWSFPGGDPATSTLQNPKVRYNSASTFDVTLTVTNALGDSTITMKDFIAVSSQGLCNTFSNYTSDYTPSLIKLSEFGNYSGYLTGHNSTKSKALSEFYSNECGYEYISGVNIEFDHLTTLREDATVNVVVWNARGPQNSPAAVIERKAILYKQIKSDIAANKPTSIVFDRETPVSGRPFHVGIELEYVNGDTLAIQSSANGEASNGTSWIQNAAGTWATYTGSLGANIALNIQPAVGMNPSVQVSASKTLVYPGEEVTLNGKGASIFVWSATDGSVQNAIGPQLVVRPSTTTTYETSGSGLELCQNKALTTIYTRTGTVTGLEEPLIEGLQIYPNPGQTQLNLEWNTSFKGNVTIQVHSVVGRALAHATLIKEDDSLITTIDASSWAQGMYFITINAGNQKWVRKWIRIN